MQAQFGERTAPLQGRSFTRLLHVQNVSSRHIVLVTQCSIKLAHGAQAYLPGSESSRCF